MNQSRYCELSVKNQYGSDRKPNFIIFLEWSALIIVGWWWRVAESCLGPAEVWLKFFSLVCRDIATFLMTKASLDPQNTWS